MNLPKLICDVCGHGKAGEPTHCDGCQLLLCEAHWVGGNEWTCGACLIEDGRADEVDERAAP